MLDLAVLVVSVVTMSLLGLVVVIRNWRDVTFKLFGLLTTTSILWFIANYFTNNVKSYNAQFFLNKLSLFVGFLLILSVWLLSLYFPRKITNHKVQRTASLVLTPTLLYLTLFTSSVVDSVVYRPEKNITDINTGSLYAVYVLTATIFFVFLVFNFYKSYKSNALNSLQRQQVLFAAIGLLLSFVWSISTAAIIPSITGNWEISKFGAVGSWFIVLFISYAIIRHKLFDIKLIVARSVAYLLSLGTLVLFYALFVLLITRVFYSSESINYVRQSIYLTAAISLGLFTPTARKFFAKATNRLFYRDAYDPQVFLDQLNQILVSTIELTKLLTDVILAIDTNLKSQYSAFSIRKTTYFPGRIIGDKANKFNETDTETIEKLIYSHTEKVIVTDYLEADSQELKDKLSENNIAVLINLSASSDKTPKGVGYMFLGPKQSGNPYNKQDIQTLEIIANELVIAIQNALRFEEIQKFNITLQEKVDEATRQLRQTNEKLKALDETKDEFISMASHQLRTPLTSVKGYLSMVLEGDTGKVSKSQEKLLDQAFTSSQRMVYLISDLLNVSRLRTGKFVIESIPMNLATAIEGEIGQLTETAKGRGLELKYDKPVNFPTLMLDETKIRQVIMNFIDNAIYYTPSGGHIDVYLKDLGSSIEFTVVDDGLGVPKADQHHLFNKFYRAGNARKARPDGTGLGLFMAQKVVVAQGGSIIFKSTEGKGSTFGFTFAKAKLMPPAHGEGNTIRTSTAVGKAGETSEPGPASDADDADSVAKEHSEDSPKKT